MKIFRAFWRSPSVQLQFEPTPEREAELRQELFEVTKQDALMRGRVEVGAAFNSNSVLGRALDELVRDGKMTCTAHRAGVPANDQYIYERVSPPVAR